MEQHKGQGPNIKKAEIIAANIGTHLLILRRRNRAQIAQNLRN